MTVPYPSRKTKKTWSFVHYGILETNKVNKKHINNKWNQGVVLNCSNSSNPIAASIAYTPLIAVNQGSNKLLLGWEVFIVEPFLTFIKNAWALEYEVELNDLVSRPK